MSGQNSSDKSSQTKNGGLSILIPALNEEHAIETTVRDVVEMATQYLDDFQILLVDDGSTDGTGAIMERLASENDAIRVVHNKTPQGVGAAFTRLLDESHTRYVTVIPGDHAYAKEGIGRMFASVGEAGLVVTYRDNQASRSQLRSLQSHTLRLILNVLFGYPLKDFHSMIIYPAAPLRRLDVNAKGYSYQIEAVISLLQLGLTHKQVPVSLNEEIKGASRALRPKTYFALGMAMLRLIARHPLRKMSVQERQTVRLDANPQ